MDGPRGVRSRGRRDRVGSAVRAALVRRQAASDPYLSVPAAPPDAPTVRALPRRPFLAVGDLAVGPPPMHGPIGGRAGLLATLRRAGNWLRALGRFGGGTLLDRLLGRDSPERRAVRLRRTLERVGGTFLKLGQQLSIRLDLLPSTTCAELSKLLDQVPPFPTREAIAAVERATGRPLGETFAAFDPEPIGSASVSCVYQAVLRSGEKVAVKVRRPGIVATFAADWRALSWITWLLETLAVVRPGQMSTFVRDLQAMFREELDFRREARHGDLFKKRSRTSRLDYLDTPKVYFELSNDEVLVSEFVSGVWLRELLWAVETDDRVALEAMAARDIDPQEVALRLYRVSLFGIFENLIFHADPHPANVVVRPGNRLVLIDFGSCGSFSQRQRAIMRQLQYCQSRKDVGGMVRACFELLEPLPPIDVDAMTREAEEVFGDAMRAIESDHSEWWERTSAAIWIGFMGLVRKYHIRVDLDVLRMIRSSLLYDTLAARLYPKLDIWKEFRRYRKTLGNAARKRARRKVWRFLTRGVDDRTFLRLEELGQLGHQITYRLQRVVDAPTFKFAALAGKAFYAITSLVRWGFASVALLLAGGAAVGVARWRDGVALVPEAALAVTAQSPLFLAAVGGLLLLTLRRILLRLEDREV